MGKAHIFWIPLFICCAISCRESPKGDSVDGNSGDTFDRTPVEATRITRQTITDSLRLSGTSVYLRKNIIKSPLTGYIENETIHVGQRVGAGELLFTLKTKEEEALADTQTDPPLSFHGELKINAPRSGLIDYLYHAKGDYIADGEDLCIVADASSLVFELHAPFEEANLVKLGASCSIALPDGSKLKGEIAYREPILDSLSQTQQFVIRIRSPRQLPENLIAQVNIPLITRPLAQTLPKNALLTDETQLNWWVMKMINDSTAIRIPIKKGMTADSMIEILSPIFSDSDRILVSGNYGLPDTALVVIKPEPGNPK